MRIAAYIPLKLDSCIGLSIPLSSVADGAFFDVHKDTQKLGFTDRA